MKKLLCFTGVLLLAVACTSSSSTGSSKTDGELNDSIIARAARWRLDSAGCKNIRGMYLAKSIIYELPENYKNSDSVSVLLGPPDSRSENKDYIELSYYHHSNCMNDSDMQWISFLFTTADRKFESLSETAN